MTLARRFVDADLREQPDLLAKAVRYADRYKGEFDFMVAAAALVHATGTLTVPVARGVLNCMRGDPRAVLEYRLVEPQDQQCQQSHAVSDTSFRSSGAVPRLGMALGASVRRSARGGRWKVTPIREPQRPAYVYTKAKVKSPWGITVGNAAAFSLVTMPRYGGPRLHRVQEVGVAWRLEGDDRVPEPRVRWLCGAFPANPTLFAERPTEYQPCQSCELAQRRQERLCEAEKAEDE